MSGIVGILKREGAPVDRDLLRRMTGFLAFRGPDAQEIWIDGEVGFGHTLLRTTGESANERQPCTLEGQVWITADARIDAREDLIRQLRAAGRQPSNSATDPELILHAYHAWNEQCLERLLGDFSFAIWDKRTRRLVCARDHFGIKLFYYSQAGGDFLFSNTLKCVRLSPAVSGKLNDVAIADFLVFGNNQNPASTAFSDIQRLPAGHYLVWSEEQVHIYQYWSLPVEGPILYNRADDYVEHFRELLRSAVRDRLRTDHVGVYMSGGLDSPSLAATAREILSAGSSSYDLRAYTLVYDRLIPDEERHYAGLVADALRIPIQFLVGDGYGLYERCAQPELHTPEPFHNPIGLTLGFDQLSRISAHCRVALYGEGPDNAMYYEWQAYFLHLLRSLRWGRLLMDACWHARYHRRLPLVGGLHRRLKRWRSRGVVEPSHPSWIRPEILNLAGSEAPGGGQPQIVHPFHPIAHGWLTGPLWDPLFEGSDAGSTSLPVEIRHPYMDVRMIRFLLATPPIPWCRDKYLIRRTFQGVLPDAVLQRRKTPLRADPVLEHAKADGLPQWVPEPSLFQYVDPDLVNKVLVLSVLKTDGAALWETLRPISLNLFLLSANQL
jgi:asparagine synthase (glutamine-hydrolysing)